MGPTGGHSASAGAVLTREVRWFRDGALPDQVLDWFAGSAGVERERRTDRYDLDAARRGVGVKQRGTSLVESKHRLMVEEAVDLAPGLTGHIEDWLKISRGPTALGEALSAVLVDVAKEIFTRRYPVGEQTSEIAGCAVELASVSIVNRAAWSLCFETFGPPTLRREGLTNGIARFLDDSPLPEGLDFEAASSSSYPAWIALHTPHQD